jgi:hypothetical protein
MPVQRQLTGRTPSALLSSDVRFDPGALWGPWLRIDRVLRVMLHTRWSVEAWSQVIERGYEGQVAKDEASVYAGGPTTR